MTAFDEIKKFYSKLIKARKEHWCMFCSHFAIQKRDEYYKVRVDAHLPYSKATKLVPICIKCAEKLVVDYGFPAENIVKNWES